MPKPPTCCPQRPSSPTSGAPPCCTTFSVKRTGQGLDDSVSIPGGTAFIGTDNPVLSVDGESPLRKTKLRPFSIGRTAVTNAQFAAFVDATGYVTDAERFGWSFVFWQQVPAFIGATRGVEQVQWWRRVDGANWRDINGPTTHAADWHAGHPVVHVSWHDATAYAKWAGGRLPSEAEWEHAARGGLGDVRYPWGDAEPDDETFLPCNIWQGRFPEHNTCADGHAATAPARSFEPNGYGLFNMCGNVWEWTAEPFRIKSLRRATRDRLAQMKGFKLTKGGSFLCHSSYCYRYRIAARMGNAPDSSTTHQGFRVAWDALGHR